MNPKAIDYAPTRHYIQHQRVKTPHLSRIVVTASDFAPDSYRLANSMREPLRSAQNWRRVGFFIVLGTATASCVGLYWLIGRLAGIVR